MINTVENAIMTRISGNTIIIDEATMLNWLSLALLIKSPKTQLITFGDPNQIGIVDMHSKGGIRHNINITEYCANPKILVE